MFISLTSVPDGDCDGQSLALNYEAAWCAWSFKQLGTQSAEPSAQEAIAIL